jgi:hypothetical protein
MDAFLKRAKPATAPAQGDVEMKDASLMQEAAKKPRYVPWVEK